MSNEHRIRMLEHQSQVKASLLAHEGEIPMSPTKTFGAPNGTEFVDPGPIPPVGLETVFRQSASIGRLALALSKAQGEMKAPGKDRTAKIPGKDGKGGYEYRYADLADVIEACRPALSKNGLAVVQPMSQRDGHIVLITRLLHESGEWIDSELPMGVYQRPQEQGSAITYARRYALSSLLGIAAEDDDDGKQAQDAQPAKRSETPARTGQSRPSGDKPECPKCGTASGVIASKFREGEFVCYDKKGGCGLKFKPQAPPPPSTGAADDPFGDELGDVPDDEVPF